jgi:hypothetical protein
MAPEPGFKFSGFKLGTPHWHGPGRRPYLTGSDSDSDGAPSQDRIAVTVGPGSGELYARLRAQAQAAAGPGLGRLKVAGGPAVVLAIGARRTMAPARDSNRARASACARARPRES